MTSLHYREAIQRELRQANAARRSGKDGMARVCARRAAGIAAEKYLLDNQLPNPGPSALDRLNYLVTLSELPMGAKKAIDYLTERVNEEFELPSNADLITEAYNLINILFPDMMLSEE